MQFCTVANKYAAFLRLTVDNHYGRENWELGNVGIETVYSKIQ